MLPPPAPTSQHDHPPGHPERSQILDRARVKHIPERVEAALGSRICVVEQEVIGVLGSGRQLTTNPKRTLRNRSRAHPPGPAITAKTNTLKHPGPARRHGSTATRLLVLRLR